MIEPVRAKKNAEQGEEEDDGAGKKQVLIFPSPYKNRGDRSPVTIENVNTH